MMRIYEYTQYVYTGICIIQYTVQCIYAGIIFLFLNTYFTVIIVIQGDNLAPCLNTGVRVNNRHL